MLHAVAPSGSSAKVALYAIVWLGALAAAIWAYLAAFLRFGPVYRDQLPRARPDRPTKSAFLLIAVYMLTLTFLVVFSLAAAIYAS